MLAMRFTPACNAEKDRARSRRLSHGKRSRRDLELGHADLGGSLSSQPVTIGVDLDEPGGSAYFRKADVAASPFSY